MTEKYTPEITASNPEQHAESLERQLSQLQLLFFDRLFQQYKNECQRDGKPLDKTFSDILEEQEAYLTGDLRLSEIIQSTRDLSDEELDDLVAKKYHKILNTLYNQLPEGKIDDNSPEYLKSRLGELNVLIDYVEAEQKKAKDEFPDKWREMTERPKNEDGQIECRAGILDFNSLKESHNSEIRQIAMTLRQRGFSESDDFLQIHLSTQIGAERKIGPKIIRESLACLAEKIIDKHPETRAIVAVSWLLDHPVFQRFIKMKMIGEGSSNWRQLIGSDGQIEQDRVKELFQNGEMPYRNLIGYIPVEKFLREYLPNERRGKIKLKRIKKDFDPDKLKIEKIFPEQARTFAAAWDSKKLDSREKVIDCLDSLPTFKGVLLHLGYYEKFLKMMVSNIGRPREDVKSENQTMHNEFEAAFKKYLNEINQAKYIEEEINIPKRPIKK